MSVRIMLAAGGTGGHLIPALSVAGELMRRGHAVTAVTDRRGAVLARRVSDIPVREVRAASPTGRTMTGKVAAGVTMLAGCVGAFRLIHAERPAVVAGFGGYPTIPPLAAAQLRGVPVLIHEQNAVLGRANRFLAPRARVVATSFAETRTETARRTVTVGVPVRDAIAALNRVAYRPPEPQEDVNLLVVGGSQGAGIFSTLLPDSGRCLDGALRQRLKVVQQCREEDVERTAAAWRALGVTATVAPFFEEMARYLADAHLVVARAGASTIAELAVSGRPSVLIPFPGAADDHQTANASVVVRAGGGWLVDEKETDARSLAVRLESLMTSPAVLARAAGNVRRLAHADAAVALAETIEDLAAGNGRACRVLKEQEA
ncbi:MAG: undecaprenyldiphospho-muramoylpentapeptide beta-N-acetylglucosaminyltransferase [bacterium]|nr:undecaprenyldiphospho-muramoylpentapeptide beta-N-acetylglucosaminyltransferase [bacterium]